MTGAGGGADPDWLPLEVQAAVVRACERLEAEWRPGTPPDLARYLDGIEPQHHSRVRAELLAVLRELEAAVASREPPVAPGSGARFQRVSPLNQGGMGVVSRALDTELDRAVALKEIREGAADDPEYRARFLAEAEITSKLEHPGIIPVYGAGRYDDGRPYYAMRLIQGDRTGSLQQAIDAFHATGFADATAARAELRALLGRFLDVCDTVEYAHSRGVIHRDLKPANILLGAYGETLVVDWGLAKLMGAAEPEPRAAGDVRLSGSGASPTLRGGRIGTPGFAAPEQMIGDLGQAGPRSDVYGLGAILYCLQTGRPSVSRSGTDLDTCIQRIRGGAFPRPRAIRPDVPRPLEAICLKAMQARPEDRYPSALAVKQELERFLAYEPVHAHQEPWSARIRRWATRHRRPVVAAAVTLTLATAVGLAAVWSLQARARATLESRNAALNRALAQAEAQRTRAESQEALAIDAIDRFRRTILEEEQLRDAPSLAGLRARLLQQPLQYFRTLRERLLAGSASSPRSLQDLVQNGLKLAVLTEEIGEHQNAIVLYRDALAMLAQPPGSSPDPRVSSELAEVHHGLSRSLRKLGQTDEALAEAREDLRLRESLARSGPGDPLAQARLADSYEALCLLTKELGDLEQANRLATQAVALREQPPLRSADDPDSRSGRIGSHATLSLILREQRQLDAALVEARAAIEASDRLLADEPAVGKFRSQSGILHDLVGLILRDQGRPDEAIAEFERACAIQERVVAAEPIITEYLYRLGTSQQHLGLISHDQGRFEAAISEVRRSHATLESVVRAHPGVTNFERDLAESSFLLSSLLFESGQTAEARQFAEQSVTGWAKLLDARPADRERRSSLALRRLNLARLSRETRDLPGAIVQARAARELLEALAQDDPDAPEYRDQLLDNLNFLTSLHSQLRQMGEAIASLRAAIALQQALAAARPADPRLRTDLASNLDRLGMWLNQKGAVVEAQERFVAALALGRELAAETPDSLANARFLAGVSSRLTGNLVKQKRLEPAREHLEEAVRWARQVVAAPEATPEDRRFLIGLLTDLKTVNRWLGDDAAVARVEVQLAELTTSDGPSGSGAQVPPPADSSSPREP